MALPRNGIPMRFSSGAKRSLLRSVPTRHWKSPRKHEEMFTPPDATEDPRPLLVIADSRGRVRCWDAIRKWPYMRDVLALCSAATPQEYLGYLEDRRIGTIVAGDDHIDMRAALEALNRKYGVKVLRVDSGGTLNSVLLHAGLVAEVSVLIHPFIAGGKADPTLSDPLKAGIPELQVPLRLQSTEVVGDGIVWARYLVRRTIRIITFLTGHFLIPPYERSSSVLAILLLFLHAQSPGAWSWQMSGFSLGSLMSQEPLGSG